MTLRKNILQQHLATTAQMDGYREFLPGHAGTGYDDPLDHPDIDPDPDFRGVLWLLNSSFEDVRTVSSCQGHGAGEKYEDVRQAMQPYVTLASHSVPRHLLTLLTQTPHLRHVRPGKNGAGDVVVVSFKQDVSWTAVRTWLERALRR